MKHAHLVIAALLFGSGALANSGPVLRPEAVMAVADSQGAPAALQRFFSCEVAGNAAYGSVASGSKAWLDVAVALLPAADGCISESLHDSIARALLRRPANVLPLVNAAPTLRAGSVCIPFLSAEEPAAKSLAYLQREEAVLGAVHEPSLQIARRSCLAEVRRTRRAIRAAPPA